MGERRISALLMFNLRQVKNMGKYLLKRIVHGILSIIAVVAIVMVLVYSLMNRELIFAQDTNYTKVSNNQKITYKQRKWQEYGYIDYMTYTDYLQILVDAGEITDEYRTSVASIGRTAAQDSAGTKQYVAKFEEYCQQNGYKVTRLDTVMAKGNRVAPGGQAVLFASRDRSLFTRLFTYFGNLVKVDNIHNASGDVGERKITFVAKDPVYGGEKFSPAIMGNGTTHKYLFYLTDKFPFIHQNLLFLNLGQSYAVNKGIEIFTTMTETQGSFDTQLIYYPTGLVENAADDLHSATYVEGSLAKSVIYQSRYTDDYTNVITLKTGRSKMGYSFIMGILSTLFAYLLGVPLGITIARNKDKLIDKIGTIYIIFIMAVPSLAYIFLFKAIGNMLGFPTTFDVDAHSWKYYVLPIVSLTLPSVGGLMRWLRRYMIDQMNSDYVRFARSTGLSENEIFSKHILKNAIIPIVHGIPGSIIFSITGAIITERVYVVPGAGQLLTKAINAYDNNVIVGMTLFYAVLSVISIILGDVLMSMVDPRISFTSKAR